MLRLVSKFYPWGKKRDELLIGAQKTKYLTVLGT